MKILVVINDYLNSSNGMCISTQRFVNEFKKRGHEVRIISNNRYGELDYSLEVLKIPIFADLIESEGYTFAKINESIIRDAVQWADIVHLEDPFLVCRKAAIIAKQLNKPITGTFHMYPENMTYAVHLNRLKLMNYQFLRLFFKSVYNRCDYVVCPTNEVKKRLIKNKIQSKLRVISNGIDDYYLNCNRKRKFDGQLRVLSVGRYAKEKKQDELIKAIAMSNHKENITLTIAGKGPLEEELIQLSKKTGVKVQLGFMSKENLRDTMLQSDIYVHCAEIEVEGMSCMEAFGCGCVPIISDAKLSSTNAFALTENNIYQGKNIKQLSEKIDYYFEHPFELEKASELYMKYAKTMSVSKSSDQLLEMMKEAMNEKHDS